MTISYKKCALTKYDSYVSAQLLLIAGLISHLKTKDSISQPV